MKFKACGAGMGRQKYGSTPPVKIQGKIGTTPAGCPSMLSCPSLNAVPAQLCNLSVRLSGTQVYQNSSFAPWCCRTTSRYAFSTLVGSWNVAASSADGLKRPTVPPVGPADRGSTTSAVAGARESSSDPSG